jgi:hypothetical protein
MREDYEEVSANQPERQNPLAILAVVAVSFMAGLAFVGFLVLLAVVNGPRFD